MSQQILDALKKLNPDNDNHWTMEGLAKLDTIKFLAGGVSVSRDELEVLAPGFNRDSMRAYLAAESANAPNVVQPTDGSGGTASVSDPSPEQGSESREAKIQALAEEIDLKVKAADDLQRIYNETGEKLKVLRKEIDDLNDKRIVLDPPEDNQTVIRKYLEKQKELLVSRGKSIQLIKDAGVDLRTLAKITGKSPIDQAMSGRKRAL